jgi:hypothetical protein
VRHPGQVAQVLVPLEQGDEGSGEASELLLNAVLECIAYVVDPF